MYKILAALLVISLHAQSQQAVDWGAFMRTVNVKEYAGKKFRLEAAVKVDLVDSTDWYLNDGPTSDHESWFCEDSSGTKRLAVRYGCHLRPTWNMPSNLLFLVIW